MKTQFLKLILRIASLACVLNLSACLPDPNDRWTTSSANWQVDVPNTYYAERLASSGVVLGYAEGLWRVDAAGKLLWKSPPPTVNDTEISWLRTLDVNVNEDSFAAWRIDHPQAQLEDDGDWAIEKIDATGITVWHVRYASAALGSDSPMHLEWIESISTLYVAGTSNWVFRECTGCTGYSGDFRIASYASNGNLNWEFIQTSFEHISLNSAKFAVDSAGIVYFATTINSQVASHESNVALWILDPTGKVVKQETIINAKLRNLTTSANNDLYLAFDRQGFANTSFISKYTQHTLAWQIDIADTSNRYLGLSVSPTDYLYLTQNDWLKVIDPTGLLIASKTFPKPPNGDIIEFNSLYIPYRPDAYLNYAHLFFDQANQAVVIYNREYQKCLGMHYINCTYEYKGAIAYRLTVPTNAGEVDILSTMILPSHRVFQGNNNNVYVVGNQFGKVKGLRQYSLP